MHGLAPTPIGVPLEFRAWLRERDGRKLWIEGEAFHDGTRLVTAEGLFIQIPEDRLAQPGDGQGDGEPGPAQLGASGPVATRSAVTT